MALQFLAVPILYSGEASAAPNSAKVAKTALPPVIDGASDDECWKDSVACEMEMGSADGGTNSKVTVRAAADSENIYLLLRLPCAGEKLEHMMWHWNPIGQNYSPGDENEDVLGIFLAEKESGNSFADIWIWRSARNSSSGFADDFHCQPARPGPGGAGFLAGGKLDFAADSGKLPWFSRYFSKFAGEKLPRFYQRSAEGSAGDVICKSKWGEDGWTIEMSRRLDTGMADDIALGAGRETFMMIFLNATPENSSGGKAYRLDFEAR